ncbi:RHS repeat domain-containing protein [Streptomyces sp. SAS_269]
MFAVQLRRVGCCWCRSRFPSLTRQPSRALYPVVLGPAERAFIGAVPWGEGFWSAHPDVVPGARRSASRPPWASVVRDRQRPFHLLQLRPAGRRTHRTAPNGAISEWSYGAAGNPTRVTTAGRTIDFAYDPVGQEATRHAGAAITIMDRRPQEPA